MDHTTEGNFYNLPEKFTERMIIRNIMGTSFYEKELATIWVTTPSLEDMTIKFSSYTMDLIPCAREEGQAHLKTVLKDAVQAWKKEKKLDLKRIEFARVLINAMDHILRFRVYAVEASSLEEIDNGWDLFKQSLKEFLSQNKTKNIYMAQTKEAWLDNLDEIDLRKTLSAFILGKDFIRKNHQYFEKIYA